MKHIVTWIVFALLSTACNGHGNRCLTGHDCKDGYVCDLVVETCVVPDGDNDGFCNPEAADTAATGLVDCQGSDNCTHIYNPDQVDSDADGTGDLCQEDDDADGICDSALTITGGVHECAAGPDNCRTVTNPDQTDMDNDGVGDRCDNCLMVHNPRQEDADADGYGDACPRE